MNSWPLVPLGELAKPKQWPTLSKAEMTESGFPVYGANGRIGYHDTFTHEKPTILIGCRGSCGTVHVTEPKSYANGNAMALDELDERRVHLGFLVQFLRQRGFRDVTSGTSQPQIIRQNIVRVEIPLPSPVEQRRIAEVLDQAEALRAKRRAALAQLDSLTQSLFLDLFGDPSTNPKNWTGKTLDDVATSIADGPFGSNMKLSDYVAEGIPVLQGKNITGDTFQWFDVRFISHAKAKTLERSKVRVGDHLLIKIGSIGYSAIIDDLHGNECAVIPANLAKITPRRNVIEDAFLHGFLTNERTAKGFAAIASKTAQPALSLGKIKAFKIPLPPIEMQREFARRVTAVERLKTAHRASLAELDALFASLQHRAFRGEL